MKKIIISVINIYQYILTPYLRTFIGSNCRFKPTCSKYACEVIEKHGVFKGSFLSLKRIIRCNPMSTSNVFDPVS